MSVSPLLIKYYRNDARRLEYITIPNAVYCVLRMKKKRETKIPIIYFISLCIRYTWSVGSI